MAIWRRDILSLGLISAALRPLSASAGPAGQGSAIAQDPQYAWLDQAGRRHRMVFDTTSVVGIGDALNFARNFYTANQDTYGIQPKDIGTVIVVRHTSTSFGFADVIWEKYGDVIGERIKLNDPRDKAAPRVNLFNAPIKDVSLANGGILVNDLVKLGARFAVCGMAAAHIADAAAKRMGGNADQIMAEISANLVPNAVMVPAGIVAVNRAQEHGYTFSYCG